MGMQVIETTYEDLRCGDCGELFTITTTTGPVGICDPCADARRIAIFGDDIPVEHILPVMHGPESCGMQKHLPRAERAHLWVSMGIDSRHFDDGYLMDCEVFACVLCGRDKMKRIKVPRVSVDEAALGELVQMSRDLISMQFELSTTAAELLIEELTDRVESLAAKKVR